MSLERELREIVYGVVPYAPRIPDGPNTRLLHTLAEMAGVRTAGRQEGSSATAARLPEVDFVKTGAIHARD